MNKFTPLAGALLAASLFLSAHAAGLEQVGSAQPNPALMKGYGVDVPVRTALRQVVPDGWELFVHKQAALPASLSWKVDEPWPSVLARFSAPSNLAVKIDWDKKSVFVRSAEIARNEAGAAAPAQPVVATLASAPSEQKIVALTGTSLSEALQKLQALHRAPFSWEAAPVGNLRIPAVTFRGLSVEDDLALLVRAIGMAPPVSFLVHRAGPVVRVMQPSPTGEHLRVVDVPFEGAVHALAGAAPAVASASTPPRAGATSAPGTLIREPAPAAAAAGTVRAAAPSVLAAASAPLILEVRRGEMLSQALGRFLRANGWNLVWKLGTEDDFENDGVDLRREGKTIAEVLTKLSLPQMGLRAEVFSSDRVVEITNTAPLAD